MTTESVTSFAQMALAPPVLQSVEEVGYETPSPIQAESIPVLLQGRDLLGQAQTGTGKTAAFALPLLSRLDTSVRQPQLLVLTPTRELAIQVAEAMQTYARHLRGFHILPIYGGQSMSIQLRQLQRGVHVIVGTPGRVMDHLRRKTLRLDNLKAVVLDEADEMLRMGFIEDVEWILEQTPQQRQVALFSATMPPAIARVARKHLNDPVEVKIKTKTSTVEAINQRFWQVSGLHKLDALTRILEAEPFEAGIIFVRTKSATVELAEKLEARGYASAALNGDMNQQAREKTVERLKKGSLDLVVATDVAARGLDVERISHVFNYDIPNDTESYVHRIGRTGRAGRKGEAILFVAPREKRMLHAIERATRQTITPMQLPSREQITGRRVDRFKGLISDTLETQELGFFEALIDGFQSEHNIGMSEIAAALAYLVQKERPLQIEERESRKPRKERGEPAARPEQSARPERRPKKSREGKQEDIPMDNYRVEVGKEHGVEPKHLVGAIANEAGIESQYIGHIKLFDTHSTIDLPEGMPKDIYKHLKRVWVCGRQLNISLLGEPQKSRKPKSFKPNSSKPKKPIARKPKKQKARKKRAE
jgi:ATP-dependent RNA helicase DeaD